jgi:glycerol-3-phosphate acyltransferase PlsX
MGLTHARIAVDAMGGDYAPREIVLGAIKAYRELGIEVILVGDPDKIHASVQHHQGVPAGIEVVAATDVIDMCENPVVAYRRKPKASITVAMELVKQGKADAVVSAGHSGAAMVSARFTLGLIPGIERPAIGAILPTVIHGQEVLVLDVGANVDCRPEFLEQFAIMGSTYCQYVQSVKVPRVGLLSIGEESSKGNSVTLDAHQRLQQNTQLNFCGNAEGRDVLSGQFDVIVCDGFVGNTLLKFAEGMGEALLGILREELPRGLPGKVGTTLLKRNLRRIKQRLDHTEHGGGLLLGVAGVCIISHGSSYAPSVFHAIRVAQDAVNRNVIYQLKQKELGKPVEKAVLNGPTSALS